ncbi:Os06g0708300 [Oryza sativa Japonica Group]|uniref:Os06g0708300 protein n=1 Tax=Oryza sativa subsp. japonica TaxID=39947 RepID=Q0D9M6_ORYSJ|nr:Os06g0708300 [Oryza sativa Japonica Group]|eukprot:NP_001058533.2 Os06g0708300 [Oryza sativa Japonica Group]
MGLVSLCACVGVSSKAYLRCKCKMSAMLTNLFFFRYAITKAFCVAFLMTFFSVFDVPVFWPILLCYWVVLFVLTMKRQIVHMIKYKYVPFSIGKQVRSL